MWANTHFSVQHPPDNQQLADFTLIHTPYNAGYAGGNNAGFNLILTYSQFKFVWVLNNDTVVHPEALSNLLEFADQQSEAGVLGSVIADYQDQTRIQCAGGYQYNSLTTITRPILQGYSLQAASKDRTPPDYICGAAMLIRTDILRQVGLFNQTFFLYYEELDYTQRLKKKDHSVAYCPNSIVYHKGGVSTGSGDKASSQLAHYHENLSTLKYTALYHPKQLIFAALIRLSAKLGLLVVRKQIYLLDSLWQAYRDFFIWLIQGKPKPLNMTPAKILYQANLSSS